MSVGCNSIKKLLLIVVIFLLSACAQSSEQIQEVISVSTPTPEATIDYMQNLILTNIRSSFSTSSHAATMTCEWCHSPKDDSVERDLVWFNETIKQLETLSTSTELCGKCHPGQNHRDMAGLSIVLAHPDFECTTCHDSHSSQASCTDSTCHTDIQRIMDAQVVPPDLHPTSTTGVATAAYICGGDTCHDLAKQVSAEPIYHQPVHHNVPCYVCHDASDMPVINNNSYWITVNETDAISNASNEENISHQIGREVKCAKCHFSDNPWNLIDTLFSN